MDLKLGLKVSSDIRQKLAALPQKVLNRIEKESMSEAGKIIAGEFASEAPVLQSGKDKRLVSGLLRKAINKKTKTYRRKVVVLVVGVQKGFKWTKVKGTDMQRRKATRFAKFVGAGSYSKSGYQIPSQYAHLAGPKRRAVFGKVAAKKGRSLASSVLEGSLRRALSGR